MADYDIGKAFEAIENELMESMIRNMKRHRLEEISEGKEWEMWQALQLKFLEEYRQKNRQRFSDQFGRMTARYPPSFRQPESRGAWTRRSRSWKQSKRASSRDRAFGAARR